jgi:hypothetical protein
MCTRALARVGRPAPWRPHRRGDGCCQPSLPSPKRASRAPRGVRALGPGRNGAPVGRRRRLREDPNDQLALRQGDVCAIQRHPGDRPDRRLRTLPLRACGQEAAGAVHRGSDRQYHPFAIVVLATIPTHITRISFFALLALFPSCTCQPSAARRLAGLRRFVKTVAMGILVIFGLGCALPHGRARLRYVCAACQDGV